MISLPRQLVLAGSDISPLCYPPSLDKHVIGILRSAIYGILVVFCSIFRSREELRDRKTGADRAEG